MTRAKAQLIEISKTELEQWVSNEIQENRYPFDQQVVAVCELKKLESCPQKFKHQSHQKWNDALEDCGAIKYGQVTLSDGSRPTVWLIGNRKEELRNYTASNIAKLYENGLIDEPI